MTASVLVTGASGQIGRRVLELLLEQNAGPIIATTRKPESLADFAARGVEVRRADYNDPASLEPAFRGAQRALLISTDDVGSGQRLAQHRAAVRAFEAAGVRHVVYTSLPKAATSSVLFAPDHAGTEAALAASRLDFTILQNNIYTDMLHMWLPGALATGKLIDARGDGALAFVTRDDCARTAVAALTAETSGRRTLEVTGPEAVSSDTLAKLAGEIFGRPIEHVRVPLEAVIDAIASHGAPRAIAEIFASLDTSIARGELAQVTDTVQRLTGKAPQSVREYLIRNRAAFKA